MLIVGWVLTRTTWQNRLTWVLCAAFIAALLAVAKPDWVHHGLAAARLGIVATLALWLVYALCGGRQLRAKKRVDA